MDLILPSSNFLERIVLRPSWLLILKIECRRGRRMSASMTSTSEPVWARLMAMLTALVVLPSDGRVRGDGVIDDIDVVGCTGLDDIILFGALHQPVQERLVGIQLLLDQAVVNGSLVLRDGLAALLVEGGAQGLFALHGLLVTGL